MRSNLRLTVALVALAAAAGALSALAVVGSSPKRPDVPVYIPNVETHPTYTPSPLGIYTPSPDGGIFLIPKDKGGRPVAVQPPRPPPG